MKKYLITFFICLGLLTGCPTTGGYKGTLEGEGNKSPYGLQAHQILIEANRLADLVRDKELTRVQAAQSLDRYRIELVGHNAVDDALFATYLRIAVDRQNNKIDGPTSQKRMKKELEGWQTRWKTLKKKPENPAFANFLMQVFELPPLAKDKN